jgi:hypothetical protein
MSTFTAAMVSAWPLALTAEHREAAETALGAHIPSDAWARVETPRSAFVTRRRAAGGVTFGELRARLEKNNSQPARHF